jgi:hypothetical protein
MAKVVMQKSDLDDIYVDETQVSAHEALGWTRSRIEVGFQEMTLPPDAAINRGGVSALSVVDYRITPEAGDTNTILAAADLGEEPQEITEGITQPDVPRLLSVTGSASGITGNVTIIGRNVFKELISETFALDGTDTIEGILAFAEVVEIDLPEQVHESGDAVEVGSLDIFGLPQSIDYEAFMLKMLFDGEDDTGGVLTLDADEIEKNLYEPAGTPDGETALDLVFLK